MALNSAYLAADWPAPKTICAFTTLRSGPGVSPPPFDRFNLSQRGGDAPEQVLKNRQRLGELLALPASPQWLQQVHGTTVARIDTNGQETNLNNEPIADASITSMPNTVLAILTADCLPVLLCDQAGQEVAAIHAGWRGLADGVIEATVRAMQANPSKILAWLGPAAGPQAYEIDAQVREAFLASDPNVASAFVATQENHWLIDLYQIARQRLAAVGVRQVFGGDLCTISDSQRFYSYRRDNRTGRMASLIWIKQ